MTRDIDNKVEISRPQEYDSTKYNLLVYYLRKNPDTDLGDLIGCMPKGDGKFEFNNRQNAIISIGLLGGNVEYPDGRLCQKEGDL